jgi:hypothetical protein
MRILKEKGRFWIECGLCYRTDDTDESSTYREYMISK